MAQQVWFITAVSSGFGYEMALQCLSAGYTVIGTVRSRQRAAKEVQAIESKGGKILELDVTNADACFDVVHQAQKLAGRIDVLVNNAGMSWLGAVEDFTYVCAVLRWVLGFVANPFRHGRDEEAKAQMEVNFHGPLRLIRAALPGFRKQKSGAIVNITSLAGIEGVPACGMYSASKFAVEGICFKSRKCQSFDTDK